MHMKISVNMDSPMSLNEVLAEQGLARCNRAGDSEEEDHGG